MIKFLRYKVNFLKYKVNNKQLGYIYCFSNKSLNHNSYPLYKIGYTLSDPNKRAKQLSNSTNIPLPFYVEFSKLVTYPKEREKAIHNYLRKERLNSKREFFKAPLNYIIEVFDVASSKEWEKLYVLNQETLKKFIKIRKCKKKTFFPYHLTAKIMNNKKIIKF